METRRKLLKSLLALPLIPFTIKGVGAHAIPLESGKKYVFLVNANERLYLDDFARGFDGMGVQGPIFTFDDPETALKIYEVG